MYGIMRVEKRGRADVYGIQLEANRTLEQHELGIDFDKSDINWDKTKDNIWLVYTESWNASITKKIKQIEAGTGKKTRKDAVVMLDGLFTATREFFDGKTADEIKTFFDDCLAFYIKEYCQGDKARVLNAVIHLDEETPHMQVASVPIFTSDTGDRLNAKIIMGNKTDYRKRQDRFYEEVSAKYGLERGEPASAADNKVHTTKREWQTAVQEDTIERNKTVITEQKEELKELQLQLKDTAYKIEFLTKEVIDNLKVNKVSDFLNKDTVTVDKKSFESLKEINSKITQNVKTINEAENIENKKEELKRIQYEISEAYAERDDIQNEYTQMKNYLSDNKSNFELTTENARLETENKEFKKENRFLKNTINIINDYIEKHPTVIPAFIINEVRKVKVKMRAYKEERNRI